jgi:hypothetical protein
MVKLVGSSLNAFLGHCCPAKKSLRESQGYVAMVEG